MSGAAATRPGQRRYGRIAAIGAAVLVVLAALLVAAPGPLQALRLAWFDAYQKLSPRVVSSLPATVVAIDERSLARMGQWPWARTTLATLVREIARHDPAAIGIDLLMPEADRLSPEQLLTELRERDPVLADRLSGLPANDEVFARAIGEAPVVLGVAGTPQRTPDEPLGPPILVTNRQSEGGAPAIDGLRVASFEGVRRNVDILDRAARGHGLLSAAPDELVIRRLPLIARVRDRLLPSFTTEMLRVAIGEPDVRVQARGTMIEHVAIGKLVLPTEPDGTLRIHYSPREADRVVSAVDVLDGNVESERLARRLVVIGATGLAMVDHQPTPLGVRMPGSEIHAQLLENVFDASWLRRPPWAAHLEVAIFVFIGIALVYVAARGRVRQVAMLGFVSLVLLIVAAFIAFRFRLVFDAATPSLALLALFAVLTVGMLVEARLHRLALEHAIRVQREREARVAGELDAAKRIQVGILPRPDALRDERRIDIAASMTPAREVGGDLYDYFRLDDDHVFVLIGDVAGKGLSASIFMAVSKTMTKSAALRGTTTTLGELMQTVDLEVSRDNAELFFVTAFACVLDLRTGELEYCNAGHENPWLASGEGGHCVRIDDGAGPPLCAVEGFRYESTTRRLRPGDLLCLFTDGMVDATNPAGERYGSERLASTIAKACRQHATAGAIVDAVYGDVHTFMAGTDPVDDYSLLVVRWNGPDPAGAPASE